MRSVTSSALRSPKIWFGVGVEGLGFDVLGPKTRNPQFRGPKPHHGARSQHRRRQQAAKAFGGRGVQGRTLNPKP